MQSIAGPRRRSLLKPLLIAALCLLTHSSNAAPTEGTKMVAAREALPNATPDMDALTDDLSRREYTSGDQGCDTNTATGQTVTCKDGKPVTTEGTGKPDTSKLFSIHTSIDTTGGWDAIQEEISTNKTAAYLLCIDLLGKSFRQKYAGRYFRRPGKAKRADDSSRADVQALCNSAGIKCDADGNILPGEGSVEDICHKRTGGGPPEVAAIESTGQSEDEEANGTNDTAVTTEPAGGWTSDEQRIQADYARGKEDEERRKKEEEERRKKEEADRAAQDAERTRQQQQGYRKERRAASPAAKANPKPDGDGITYNADGSYITADQAVHRPDGTYTTPDGAVHRPDGSYTTNDGVVHQPDGSYTTADGAVHKPDGSYTLADGTAYNADGSLASSGSQQQETNTTGIERADPTNRANLFTLDTSSDGTGADDTGSTTTGIEMADPNHRGGPQPKRQQFASAYLRRPGRRSAGAEDAFDIEGAGVAGEDLGKRFDAREARAEEAFVERRTEKKVRGGQLRRMVAAERSA